MKKLICLLLAAVVLTGAFASCTPKYATAPDEYEKISWAAPDYSFIIYPDNNCEGTYKFDGTTYNIRVEFETAHLTVRDTDNSDTRLFVGDWMYEDDALYIYNIQFNTDDYEAFKENYAEYVRLTKEDV